MNYQLPIFENLCPSWSNILHLGIRRAFARGTLIIDMGRPVNGIYLVREGSVEVILNTLHGPEKALYYVGPGCIFGEVSCFVGGEIGEAHVVARSNCVCYFFSRELIEGMIASQHPHMLIELIRAEAYKIRMYGILLQDSLGGDDTLRVCRMLIYLAHFKNVEVSAGVLEFEPGVTQTDMARLMGVHRVTVAKAVGRLRGQGILGRFTRKNLQILDFASLQRLAESEG